MYTSSSSRSFQRNGPDFGHWNDNGLAFARSVSNLPFWNDKK